LAALGWEQKTSFDEGLSKTVDWYSRFGEVWWGDISRVLTPYPVVEGTEIWTKEEHDDLSSSDGEAVPEHNNEMWTQHAKQRLQTLTGAE
jgi:hypothetical protein